MFSRLASIKSTLELSISLTLHNTEKKSEKNFFRFSKMKQQETQKREILSSHERLFRKSESMSEMLSHSTKSHKVSCMCRRNRAKNFHDGSPMTNLPIKSMR